MARGDNILQRIVRLIFDRAAAQRAQKQAEGAATGFDRAFGRIKTAAIAAGAAIGAALAIRRIIEFGRASVQEAAKAEQSWTRLGQSLSNVGVRFEDVERRIRLAASAMQDTTRFGDEEFADTLSELVQISGDFEASFQNVAVAVDVASAKQIDLRTAAQLVGRAMIGETTLLKRYGIIVQEGADAVEVMRGQFRGFAEREGKTFAGKLAQYTNALGDFREEVGGLIVTFLEKTAVIDALTGALKRATEALANFNRTAEERARDELAELSGEQLQKALDDNFAAQKRVQDRIAELERARARTTSEFAIRIYDDQLRTNRQTLTRHFAAIGRIEAEMRNRQTLSGVVGVFDPEELERLAAEAEKRRVADIRALSEGLELRTLTAADIARAHELEAQITAELGRGNVELARRNQLLKEQQTLRNITLSGPPQAGLPAPSLAPGGGLRSLTPGMNAEVIAEGLRAAARARDEFFHENVMRAQDAADQMTDAFASFFDSFILGLQAGHNAFESLAQGFVGIGRFIVAQLIEGWAESQVALGTAKLASGTWPPNPAAIKSASLHFLAAGLFKALAGAIASAGQPGRAGGLPTGSRLPTESSFGGDRPEANVTIILQGDFSALDPRVQAVVFEAQQYAQERYGSRGRVLQVPRR